MQVVGSYQIHFLYSINNKIISRILVASRNHTSGKYQKEHSEIIIILKFNIKNCQIKFGWEEFISKMREVMR